MPLIATRGAASAQGFGEFAQSAAPVYIEDVFSTYLYTGNGSTQTITNGIDLSGEGGLVWWKNRTNATGHGLIDTTRGIDYYLSSNTTDAQDGPVSYISSVSSTGYSIGAGTQFVNQSANNYVSWTFRKQPKFFDVVTYTGTGAVQNIAHNLGSVPGCIIVKTTNATTNWIVQHRSSGGGTQRGLLNSTSAFGANSTMWDNTNPTSSVFTVGTNADTNQSGNTFVAYLFAHDAGGFGLTGTDNVISCGSYTGSNSTATTVNLGYEPQWIMIKRATGSTSAYTGWAIFDNMRGMPVSGNDNTLLANTSDAENPVTANGAFVSPTATGFTLNVPGSNLTNTTDTFIYVAIRRGPMKVPTLGTSVFSPVTTSGTGTNNRVITGLGFSPDMIINCTRGSSALDRYTQDRLRGVKPTIYTNSTSAEQATQGIYAVGTLDMSGFTLGTSSGVGFNSASDTYVFECFKRAPSFFDEVCYTGTGSQLNVNHNLGSVPELIIVKNRNKSGGENWAVYSATLGAGFFLWLNATDSVRPTYDAGRFPVAPTSSVFTVGSDPDNGGSFNYVAYLFATCAGVSKVGSYTGTATTKQIDCGFTAGSRFVMIKRTDSTGDWYVWDSARGIVAGDDPYLLLNSTAAEVTNTDYVDTYSAGFEISSTAPAAINANGGTFIFLAIA